MYCLLIIFIQNDSGWHMVKNNLKQNIIISSIGHVGAPMPCNIIKLVDVEEMNYFAVKGEGEVSCAI